MSKTFLIYDELTRSYRLSSAYDMYYSNTYYMEHTISVNDNGTNILVINLIKVGKEVGLDGKYMIKTMDKVKDIVKTRISKYS